MQEWLDRITEEELVSQLPDVVQKVLTCVEVEAVACAMDGPVSHLGVEQGWAPAGGSYWEAVQREVYDFLCTEEAKYDDLRTQVREHGVLATGAFVGSLSAAIAGIIGVAAGVVTTFVLLALIAMIRIGKEAWCRQMSARYSEGG